MNRLNFGGGHIKQALLGQLNFSSMKVSHKFSKCIDSDDNKLYLSSWIFLSMLFYSLLFNMFEAQADAEKFSAKPFLKIWQMIKH